jgi:hypothetical protein
MSVYNKNWAEILLSIFEIFKLILRKKVRQKQYFHQYQKSIEIVLFLLIYNILKI